MAFSMSSTRLAIPAAQTTFESDLDVLNFALRLEHLGAAFYARAADLSFGTDGFGNSIDDMVAQIAANENQHVEILGQTIADLGGEPVAAEQYAFEETDEAGFLTFAAMLENTDVSAYDGAGALLSDPDLLTAAGSIVAVEARHAAYLNLITGNSPFPASFETPVSPDEVLATVSPFIVVVEAGEPIEGEAPAEATPVG
jgi:rubrerythrin